MPSLLLVKTSSLGDVVHALPVLSDLARSRPDLEVHWLVEEGFACLPALHPFVRSVVPVAMRRWRKAPWSVQHREEWSALRQHLRTLAPDRVLDLQGLLKSAVLTRLSPGERHGYDWASAREPLASLFYQHRHAVARNQHAVARNRRLAALALGSEDGAPCDYGLQARRARPGASAETDARPAAVLLHASSRDDKLWPVIHWQTLGRALDARGLQCLLPAGNTAEYARACAIAAGIPGAAALPSGPLAMLLPVLARARLAVGVDTGLTHLATAFGLPTVALFTATDPAATGVYGSALAHNLGGIGVCPPVEQVINTLEVLGALAG